MASKHIAKELILMEKCVTIDAIHQRRRNCITFSHRSRSVSAIDHSAERDENTPKSALLTRSEEMCSDSNCYNNELYALVTAIDTINARLAHLYCLLCLFSLLLFILHHEISIVQTIIIIISVSADRGQFWSRAPNSNFAELDQIKG